LPQFSKCSLFFSCQDNPYLSWHRFTSCINNTILYLIVLTYLMTIAVTIIVVMTMATKMTGIIMVEESLI
jgi:hypothetical protein